MCSSDLVDHLGVGVDVEGGSHPKDSISNAEADCGPRVDLRNRVKIVTSFECRL